MEKTSRGTPTLITTNETVLCAELLATPPRLTPTGKISHAKTRVYTQRYRKEWEQMPDFKGWLTSVPFQQTRAYCIYCKKNLHAHRLSLLKHTCTMKHQRAAIAYVAEEKKRKKRKPEIIMKDESIDNPRTEEEEENEEDDAEYVVERLETDEEEEVEEIEEVKEDTVVEIITEEAQEKMDNNFCAQLSDSEDSKSVIKKVKLSEKKCRDTLAEAMAHVHSEYLEEEVEEQESLQMEVVEDDSANTMQVMSILPEAVDNVEEASKEMLEDSVHSEIEADKKSTKLLEDGKGNLVVTSLPILETTYQINTSSPSTQNVIMTPLSIASTQNRTITLTSGKTLTLTGSTFQPGTQYVLSKIKGKLPSLMVTDKKPIVALNQTDSNKTAQLTKVQSPAIPGTSQQQTPKKMQKSVSKKLRISTHVIDTTKGLPIGGLQVSLYKLMDGRWTFINESNTNPTGRCIDLLDNAKLNCASGRYKIHLDIAKYFTLRRIETMYPFIEIALDVKNPVGHYHIPIFLSPFGFSTYRCS